MRRLRIAILGASPCHSCSAWCCRQRGHDYAAILDEDERQRFAAFSIDVPIRRGAMTVMERVLPYRNGRCIFLDAADRCMIYDDRPHACRRFECVDGYHQGGADMRRHGEFLQGNPQVVQMLDAL